MTYKLNPSLEKIISPIVFVFLDGTKREYESGREISEAEFEKRYIISSLWAVDNKVEIALAEAEMESVGWIGEEQVSLFDG